MKDSRHLWNNIFCIVFVLLLFQLPGLQNSIADVSNVRLNTDITTQLQNEEMIWVSPTDSNIVMAVWRDFRLGYRKVAIGISTDGGYTWIDSLMRGGVYPRYSDPAIWCDRFGNFYPLVMNFDWSSYGRSNLALYKTTDNGASWTGPSYAVWDTVNDYLEDKEFMVIDRTGGTYDGNIYICWARFDGARIMFVRSTDGGTSWSDTLVLGKDDETGQFSFPLVDAFGNVYVVWRDWVFIEGYWRPVQRMRKSTDGGQTFDSSKVIMVNNEVSSAGIINIYNMCAMDADITSGPYRGNIYLAVPDGMNETPNSPSNIAFIKSTDGGDTWSAPIIVNDDEESSGAYQFHPWMVVNQEGIIIVFFYDQRNDAPFYRKFDSYIAFSFDGGETFTTNYRVSDVSSDPNLALTNIDKDDSYRPPFSESPTGPLESLAGLLGEYIGVSAYYNRVHCVWTDTREGDQNVYYSNFSIPFLLPRLYSLEDDTYTPETQPGFYWAACGFFDEVTYNLEISTDSDFNTIDFYYPDIDTNAFTITSPLSETTYFWRVKAYKASDTSDYSAVYSFTVDTTSPDIPPLISPADSTTIPDTMPEFSWSEVSPLLDGSNGAPIYYNLQISSDSDFTPRPELLEYSNIYNTSYSIPDPLPDYQAYYWRVKATDEAGNQGEWQDQPFWFWLQVYLYGDANGNGEVTISDVVYLANYIFRSGPDPITSYAGDVNCNGETDVVDIVYLVNYLFRSGPEPCSE
jgi:hypothetical protein